MTYGKQYRILQNFTEFDDEKAFENLLTKIAGHPDAWSVIPEGWIIDCVRVREAIERLGQNNLVSGDASEEHKLLRTGYDSALKDMREVLGL